MPTRDLIVIGASAGGVEALTTLVRELPEDVPAAIFVVLHIPPQSPSLLADILTRAGPLPAIQPRHGAPIERARIYVASPDHHLLIGRGHIHVVRGPKENRHRPAIDPLFRSAARIYGPRVIGVVLTGTLDDGTAGLLAIKRRGGIALVQDPTTALFPGMPQSAIENVAVDHVLSPHEIPAMLARLAHEPAEEEGGYPVSDEMDLESRIMEVDPAVVGADERPGVPSVFSCPDCGGVLWEVHDGDLIRFRCRVGHAFSAESILAGQTDMVESALWSALKTLEESLTLSKRLARQMRERGHKSVAARFEEKARDAEQHAQVIRQVLMRESLPTIDALKTDRPEHE